MLDKEAIVCLRIMQCIFGVFIPMIPFYWLVWKMQNLQGWLSNPLTFFLSMVVPIMLIEILIKVGKE